MQRTVLNHMILSWVSELINQETGQSFLSQPWAQYEGT